MIDLDHLTARISAQAPRMSSDFDLTPEIAPQAQTRLRPAEVLLGITIHHAKPHVLLTMRARNLTHHPAQIAFPGGKVEAYDRTPGDAALREAHEEVGLDPDAVEILTPLPPHQTVTGFEVTPILARIKNFALTLCPREVDEAFLVPLSTVFELKNYRLESRLWKGQTQRDYVIAYGPYYIWGATARILHTLAIYANETD